MNKNSVPEFTVVPTPLPPPPSHLLINLIPDASVANAPVGFWSAMTAAAQFFDNAFSDPITVNIRVGWDEIGGVPLSNGDLGEGGPVSGALFSYNQVRAALASDAKSRADMTALASLPAADPTNGGSFFVGGAEEKALGLTAGNAAAVDGQVGFQSDPSFRLHSIPITEQSQVSSILLELPSMRSRMRWVASIILVYNRTAANFLY